MTVLNSVSFSDSYWMRAKYNGILKIIFRESSTILPSAKCLVWRRQRMSGRPSTRLLAIYFNNKRTRIRYSRINNNNIKWKKNVCHSDIRRCSSSWKYNAHLGHTIRLIFNWVYSWPIIVFRWSQILTRIGLWMRRKRGPQRFSIKIGRTSRAFWIRQPFEPINLNLSM